MKSRIKNVIIIGLCVLCIVLVYLIFPPTKVDRNIANYEKYLSKNLGEYEYTKIGINEEIFPASISSEKIM